MAAETPQIFLPSAAATKDRLLSYLEDHPLPTTNPEPLRVHLAHSNLVPELEGNRRDIYSVSKGSVYQGGYNDNYLVGSDGTVTSSEDALSRLEVLHSSQYHLAERWKVDQPKSILRRAWYIWEEETAGSDPYSWEEEFYRMAIPTGIWVEPLLLRAWLEGQSQGVVPANLWGSTVRVNTYTGDGGTRKEEPAFDEKDWEHSLVVANLSLTPTTISIGVIRRHFAW